ncbi:MAG: thioesterase family protein [Planctomycetota bacterium]
MGKTFKTNRRVEFRDTDAAGIMHFSVFFTVMERAEHEFLRHLGMSVFHKLNDRVYSWPRVSAKFDYVSPARFEEVLDLEIVVEKIGTKSVTYGCQISHKSKEVANGRIVAVCCDVTEGKVAKSVAIPDEIRTRLSEYLVDSQA